MPYVQWTRGIGGHELHLDLATGAGSAAAVLRTLFQHLADYSLVGCGFKKKIDKSWTGDFDPGDELATRHSLDDQLR
jgi:hypothetical protein